MKDVYDVERNSGIIIIRLVIINMVLGQAFMEQLNFHENEACVWRT